MESAYSLANTEISEIRRKNKEELRRREEEVRRRAPEFAEVEAKLTAGGIALAKCVLVGTSDISAIRSHIEAAQNEKAKILRRLSLPDDYLNEIYSCDKCHDTGFDENGARCECLKNMVSKYIGANSNLTSAMRGQSFKNFDFGMFEKLPDIKGHSALSIARKVYEKGLSFATTFDKNNSNLFMYGSAGTGKTYLSSCIANKALERGFSVYYQSAFQLLDTLEKLKFGRFDEDEEAGAQYASKYAYDVDLLIIDDLGTEFRTQYTDSILFDIINSRTNENKNMIISTNLNPTQIEATYSQRISSRILGNFEILLFLGNDLRINK